MNFKRTDIHTYMYNLIIFLYTWNNIVNQLYFIKKIYCIPVTYTTLYSYTSKKKKKIKQVVWIPILPWSSCVTLGNP